MTLDDKYQKQRREKMNREPANIQEGLARGVKGLGMVCIAYLQPNIICMPNSKTIGFVIEIGFL